MNNSTSTQPRTTQNPPARLTVDDGVTTLRQTAARLGNPYALSISTTTDGEETVVAVIPIVPPGDRKRVERLAAQMAASGCLLAAAKDAALRLREFVNDRLPSPTLDDLVEVHALDEAIRQAEGRAA